MKESIGAFLFVAVACLLAGLFIGLGAAGDEKRLNPVDAYCRGYSDAIVFFVANGAGGIAPRVLTDDERDQQEAGCAEAVSFGENLPFARGPILPE